MRTVLKHLAALAVLAISALPAAAQSTCPTFSYGAVLTPGQWQACFDAKQNALGYVPVNRAGDVMQGPLGTFASALASSGFNVPPGVAPTSPVNGDVWTTSAGLFVRIAGTTIGPLTGGSGGSFAGTSPIGVTFPAGVVTYAWDFSVANTWLAQQTAQGATTTSPGWYAQITGDTFARVRVGMNATDVPSIAFGPGSGVRDAFIERVGAGAIRFGAPDAATAVAQTLSVQNVVAGTSNTAGANLTIAGSQGTGTGVGGSIIFQTAAAGGSGSTQNALAAALTLNSAKLATFAGHLSVEGVTSTGATGTGKFVFDAGSTMSALTVTGSFTATGLVTLADLATQNANTVLVNATSGAASPTAQAVPSCSGAASALQWTTNTGIGCGTITAAASSVSVGVTTVLSGADKSILYQNGASPTGTIGEYTVSGTGTVVAMQTGASLVTPALGVATATTLAIGGATIGANALAVTGHLLLEGVTSTGATGTGNLVFATAPTFGSTVNAVTGYQVNGAATSAHFLRGNGTNFVDAAIAAGDLPLATNAAIGGMRGDTVTISCTAGVCTAVGAAATSVDAGGATTTVSNGVAGDILYISGTSPLYLNKLAPNGGTIVSGGNFQLDGNYTGFALSNCTLAATVGSNLLTVAVKDNTGADPTAASPCGINYRSATAATGSTTLVSQTAALSISTNATGATLGSVNAAAFRFWVVVFNNSGTNVLALINCTDSSGNVYPLDESQVASSTPISGSATSVSTFYTPNGTTITSKAFRVLGYIEYNSTGLATAGTYASGPNFIQNFNPSIKLPGAIIQSKFITSSTADNTTSNAYQTTHLTTSFTMQSAANVLSARYASTCEITAANSGIQHSPFWNTTQFGSANILSVGTAGTWDTACNGIGATKPNSISAITVQAKFKSTNNSSRVDFNNNSSGLTTTGAIEVFEIQG